MRCINHDTRFKQGEPCEPATHRVWCPTWITAHQGPIAVCDKCAQMFKPEHNSHVQEDDAFFWDDKADEAFRSVEAFFPKSDPRFEGAKGMMLNHLRRGKFDGATSISMALAVIDGKVWIGYDLLISRLGDYSEVKKRFPAVFRIPLIVGKWYVLDRFAEPKPGQEKPEPTSGPFDTKEEAEADRVQMNIAEDCYCGIYKGPK